MAVFIFLLVLYLFKNFVLEVFFKFLVKFFTCSCFRKVENRNSLVVPLKKENFSEDILFEMEISQLSQLYKRSARELNEYKELLANQNYDKAKF